MTVSHFYIIYNESICLKRTFYIVTDFSSSLTDKAKGPESEKESDHEVITILTRIGAESRNIYKKLNENKSVIINAIEYKPHNQSEELLDVEGECCKHWKEKYESVNASLIKVS